MFLTKLLKRTTRIIAPAALAIWLAAIGYMMSWSGHRPLQPDPTSGRIHAVNIHGSIMYVSATDLFWWHLGAWSAAILFVIAVACDYAAKYLGKSQPQVKL